MLEFENCQSLEKLVIDDEICGMALRLIAGIERREEVMGGDLLAELSGADRFLTSPATLRWMRAELTFPASPINRQSPELWEKNGRRTAFHNARERVRELLAGHRPKALPEDRKAHLSEIIRADAGRHGAARLPGL